MSTLRSMKSEWQARDHLKLHVACAQLWKICLRSRRRNGKLRFRSSLLYCSPALKAPSMEGATAPIPSVAIHAESVDTSLGIRENYRPLSEPGCGFEFFLLCKIEGLIYSEFRLLEKCSSNPCLL